MFCGSTKKIGDFSSKQFKKIYWQILPRVLNVSKAGDITNSKTVAALITVKEWTDQVQEMTLLTLRVPHFNGALGYQLAELQEN